MDECLEGYRGSNNTEKVSPPIDAVREFSLEPYPFISSKASLNKVSDSQDLILPFVYHMQGYRHEASIHMEVSTNDINGTKPIAGWFISWKIPSFVSWMMTGGSPMTKRNPPQSSE